MARQKDGNDVNVGAPDGEPPRAKEDRWPWIAAVLLALIGMFVAQDRMLHGPLPFSRERWDAEPEDWRDETRERLADGLLAARMLIGKSRAEVTALLGEPPPPTYFSEYDMVYWLGAERGWFRIDSEWLVVRLDANKRVSEARISTD
jgi:hypothetical protein